MSENEIRNDVAYVTGAASGVGLAVTKQLIELGARVIMVDFNEGENSKLATEFNQKAGQTVALAFKADIRVWDEQLAAYEQGRKEFGRVDYFIANAGIMEIPMLPNFNLETASSRPIVAPNMSTLETDLKGNILTASLAFQVFERQERNRHGFRGKMVFTSSVYGVYPCALQPMYTTSKAGICHIMRSAAQFYEDKAITVNAVCPNLMETKVVPDPTFFDEFHQKGYLTQVDFVVKQYISLLGGNKSNGRAICVSRDDVWDHPIDTTGKYEENKDVLDLIDRKLEMAFGY